MSDTTKILKALEMLDAALVNDEQYEMALSLRRRLQEDFQSYALLLHTDRRDAILDAAHCPIPA